jgi:hypothetical protein
MWSKGTISKSSIGVLDAGNYFAIYRGIRKRYSLTEYFLLCVVVYAKGYPAVVIVSYANERPYHDLET